MKKYKLTVVTTTYNQEKFIEECIKGIIFQKTNFPFQLLICDDCSTDGTRAIIDSYKKQYPDIIKTIYSEKNIGPMNNFIYTLNQVHTEYVALCDGDDFWTDTSKLQKQVDFLDKHKDYNICFHQVKIFFEDGSKEPVLHPTTIKKDPTFEDLLKENFMTANTVVYRWIYRSKDSFIKDFPKDIIPGDYYVHIMHAAKGKIHYINKQMSCYRRQNQGMWYATSQPNLRSKFYLKNGLKMLKFYEYIEKKLSLKKEVFLEVKNWLIIEIIKSYVTNLKIIKLKKFYNKYYVNNKQTFVYAFSSMNFKCKLIYVIGTDIFYKFRNKKERACK